jgi:hypothetical protein
VRHQAERFTAIPGLLASEPPGSQLVPTTPQELSRCRPCYRTRVHRPDVRMPGIDGIELLRRLKSLKASRPVIVHFRHADVPLAIEAMKPRPCRRRRYLRPGSLAIVEFLRIDAAQRKSEYRSATGVWRDGNLPPVRFDNSAGNREANPHATSFRRGEGLE